jgi:hypothetical protein
MANKKPQYVEPHVRTMTESDLVDEAGPAQAYSGAFPFDF